MVVPFNPCGAVCDFGRRPYTTRARLFRDSPTEVDLVWYPAKPDAPVLPFTSSVLSLDWTDDPWLDTPLGEVPGAPRVYNRQTVKPLAGGNHQCGTPDDFEWGAHYDPLRPPILYRPDGLPWCCGNALVGIGGGAGGGLGTVTVTGVLVGSGGGAGGGLGTVYYSPLLVGSGGGAGGGLGTVYYSPLLVGSGGGAGGGLGTVSYTPPPPIPGHDCSNAGGVVFGDDYLFAIPASPAQHWFSFPVTTGSHYRIRHAGVGVSVTMTVWEGWDCSSRSIVTLDNTGPLCSDLTAGGNWMVWIQFVNSAPVSRAYGFTPDTGVCP